MTDYRDACIVRVSPSCPSSTSACSVASTYRPRRTGASGSSRCRPSQRRSSPTSPWPAPTAAPCGATPSWRFSGPSSPTGVRARPCGRCCSGYAGFWALQRFARTGGAWRSPPARCCATSSRSRGISRRAIPSRRSRSTEESSLPGSTSTGCRVSSRHGSRASGHGSNVGRSRPVGRPPTKLSDVTTRARPRPGPAAWWRWCPTTRSPPGGISSSSTGAGIVPARCVPPTSSRTAWRRSSAPSRPRRPGRSWPRSGLAGPGATSPAWPRPWDRPRRR